MNIYFVNAESEEAEYFAKHLTDHETCFVKRMEWVPAEAELVSIFIESKVDTQFLESHPRLRCVVTRSHSSDHIDLEACRARGVSVLTVKAYDAITTAEHTFALILALSRRLRTVMTLPKNDHFSYEANRAFDLHGKTLGIIGMGRIGQSVARLARGFSMEVLASDPAQDPALAEQLGFSYVGFEELLQRAHVVTLHASLTPATYHLLNRETLAKCRPGVLIINTARGSLLDTQALREGLDSGHIEGAGLDVLQDERVMRASASSIISKEIVKHLQGDDSASESHDADRLRNMQELILGDAVLSRKNVVFTPHVAFNSREAVQSLREGTLENIATFLRGAVS